MNHTWTNTSCCLHDSEVTESRLFFIPIGWTIFLLLLMIAVLVLTVVGNILVMIVLIKSDALNSDVNSSFLISLSIADVLVGILVMPCALDTLNTGQWRCGALWKDFNAFGNFCFCIASIMHLMMLSVDRYWLIMRPLHYPIEMTKNKALVICALLWVYSAGWALLPIAGVSSYECFIPYIGKCEDKDWSKYGLNFAFAVSVVSGSYGVALICMFFVHIKIAQVVRSQINRTAPREIATSRASLTKAIKLDKGVVTLLVVISTYLLCWSPFCVLLFVEVGRGEKVRGCASMVTMLIGFTNSCCNPIIYSIKHRKFRLAIKRMLGGSNLVRSSAAIFNSESNMDVQRVYIRMKDLH